MKSKLIALAIAGLTGLAASADVLYWQVNNSAADNAGDQHGRNDYAYAILRATTGNSATDGAQYYVSENINAGGDNVGAFIGRETFGSTYVGGVMDAAKILSFDTAGNAYGVSGASLSALSFFIELYDSNGSWVGETSPVMSYADLVNNGTISSGFNSNFTGVNSAMGASGTGYQGVPEPTSGLLMLVGLGALALRRRRA